MYADASSLVMLGFSVVASALHDISITVAFSTVAYLLQSIHVEHLCNVGKLKNKS